MARGDSRLRVLMAVFADEHGCRHLSRSSSVHCVSPDTMISGGCGGPTITTTQGLRCRRGSQGRGWALVACALGRPYRTRGQRGILVARSRLCSDSRPWRKHYLAAGPGAPRSSSSPPAGIGPGRHDRPPVPKGGPREGRAGDLVRLPNCRPKLPKSEGGYRVVIDVVGN